MEREGGKALPRLVFTKHLHGSKKEEDEEEEEGEGEEKGKGEGEGGREEEREEFQHELSNLPCVDRCTPALTCTRINSFHLPNSLLRSSVLSPPCYVSQPRELSNLPKIFRSASEPEFEPSGLAPHPQPQ